MPGLVAIAGDLQWDMLTILPGLVASGGALLFGVNSWCLDGRGALWRDSLPVAARLVFVSRAIVPELTLETLVIRGSAAANPPLLKPIRLTIAWSCGRRASRGRGLPGWGCAVTVPISTEPNPRLARASMPTTP